MLFFKAELNASKIFILWSNWGPWSEVKSSNIIKFRLPSQFQRFLYQTLCVFSQIKERKHIELNFYSFARVMPRGVTWGVCVCVCGGGGGSGCVSKILAL